MQPTLQEESRRHGRTSHDCAYAHSTLRVDWLVLGRGQLNRTLYLDPQFRFKGIDNGNNFKFTKTMVYNTLIGDLTIEHFLLQAEIIIKNEG